MSQLKLSLQADVSARHISFLETGRSSPTPEMVSRLAEALELHPDQRAELMRAAGFWEPSLGSSLDGAYEGHGGGDLDVVLAIERAGTADEAAELAGAALARIGLSHFFVGTLAQRQAGAGAVIHDHVANAPLGWLQHYRLCGYGRVDPLVRATAARHLPFFWSEVLAGLGKLNPAVRRMFGEAKSFRISEGFVMPVHRANGSVHALSAMAERVETADPRAHVIARTISIALLHRLDEIGAPAEVRLMLAQAERDWLAHLLDGRSVERAGQLCGWGEMEVLARGRQACAKLGASDPLLAALRARRLQLLPA
jgi:transcriptional regulator with XRE-family HTH domain